MTSPFARAEVLTAVAAALDEHSAELAELADTETALGRRAADRRGGPHHRPAAPVRRGAARRRLPRRGGDRGRRRRHAGPAPDQPAGRAGRGVRRLELPVRLLRGRRGHRVGAGRRVPGHRQGARGASAHLGGDRRRHRQGAGGRGGAGRGCSAWCTGCRPGSGCCAIRLWPRPGSPAPPAAAWPCSGSAPGARCRSRSSASWARSIRWSSCPGRPRPAPRRSPRATRAR